MTTRVTLKPAAGQVEREMPSLAAPVHNPVLPWPGARFGAEGSPKGRTPGPATDTRRPQVMRSMLSARMAG